MRHFAKTLALGGGAEPLREAQPNLDVLVSGPDLVQATAGLAVRGNQEPLWAKLALARLLASIAGDHDMVLIDCPPRDEALQTAAVAAARWALVPVKSDKSSREGLSAVAARLDGVLDINPTLNLRRVVLVDTDSSAKVVQRETRDQIANLFNSDRGVVFTSTVRHSEATAQATRERGLLVHELDEHNPRGPTWHEIVRGDTTAQTHAPRTAASVANDLHAITQEVAARITESAALEASA